MSIHLQVTQLVQQLLSSTKPFINMTEGYWRTSRSNVASGLDVETASIGFMLWEVWLIVVGVSLLRVKQRRLA